MSIKIRYWSGAEYWRNLRVEWSSADLENLNLDIDSHRQESQNKWLFHHKNNSPKWSFIICLGYMEWLVTRYSELWIFFIQPKLHLWSKQPFCWLELSWIKKKNLDYIIRARIIFFKYGFGFDNRFDVTCIIG